MSWFSRTPKKPRTIIDKFNKAFSNMDFESPRKMKKLQTKATASRRKLLQSVDKIKEQIEVCNKSLESHDERKAEANKQQQILADRLQEASKEDQPYVLMELRSCQFSLKGMDRERRDYEMTQETLKHFLVDVSDAISVLTNIIDSLKRNMIRVKAAQSILDTDDEDFDFSDNVESVLGFEIDLSDAGSVDVNESRLKKVLVAAEKKLDAIATKAKTTAIVRVGNGKNIGFYTKRNEWFFAVDTSRGMLTMYESYRRDAESLVNILEKLPELLKTLEDKLKAKGEKSRRITRLTRKILAEM